MSHKFSTFIKKYGNVFVIIALIIIFTLLNPVFLSVYNFMNIVRQIAMVGIISVVVGLLLMCFPLKGIVCMIIAAVIAAGIPLPKPLRK